MGLLNETNLKSLIEKVPHNALVTTKWLEEQGFSRQLLSKYTKNNWLKKLPKWFKTLYGQNTELNRTTFLPKNIGFKEQYYGNFSIKIPTLERSILEMLYLVPEKITLNEAYQIIETITTVKPKEFEILLEECSSVKVKRLFLYMADEVNFNWFKRLNLTKINLGKGVREITKGGKYNKKYNIIIGDIEEI